MGYQLSHPFLKITSINLSYDFIIEKHIEWHYYEGKPKMFVNILFSKVNLKSYYVWAEFLHVQICQ